MQDSKALFLVFILIAILSAAAIVIAAWITRPTPATPPVTVTAIQSETSPPPPSCEENEHLEVYFDAGPSSVQTAQSYSGEVFMIVSGSGQASGTEFTDAFYRFTDPGGNDTSPSVIGFSFAINGRLAREFIPGRRVPPYSDDHVYFFSIMAPGDVLSFGVHDVAVDDNTGSYEVTVCRQ